MTPNVETPPPVSSSYELTKLGLLHAYAGIKWEYRSVITRGGRQTAGPLYDESAEGQDKEDRDGQSFWPVIVVCPHCLFTLSLSSLSLCLRFLSRSILFHSSSNSGNGGRPCSSCCWHLSIWKHSGQCMKQSLCIPITPYTVHPPGLIQF